MPLYFLPKLSNLDFDIWVQKAAIYDGAVTSITLSMIYAFIIYPPLHCALPRIFCHMWRFLPWVDLFLYFLFCSSTDFIFCVRSQGCWNDSNWSQSVLTVLKCLSGSVLGNSLALYPSVPGKALWTIHHRSCFTDENTDAWELVWLVSSRSVCK